MACLSGDQGTVGRLWYHFKRDTATPILRIFDLEVKKLRVMAMLRLLTLCWSAREREEMRPQIPYCHDEYDESS